MNLLIFTIVLFVLFPFLFGTLAVFLFGRKNKTLGSIGLLFHSISDVPAMHCSYYSCIKFETLICRLRGEGFRFLTVSQIAQSPDYNRRNSIVMTFDDGFETFYSNALPLCERHGIKTTVFPVAGFLGKSSSWDALPQQSHLTKNQIIEISSLGHEIGSHTLTHANLTLLPKNELYKELSESKKILEDILGKPVKSISFPFGRVDERVWNAAKDVGYTFATSYVLKGKKIDGILPLWGAYSYDSVQDIIERAVRQPFLSHTLARGRLMPHFAKGSPLWKFRSTYKIVV